MAFRLTNVSVLSWREAYQQRQAKTTTEMLFDLAPLVDVIFTLILFFMLTSPFVTQWGIKVTLPALKNITPVTISEVEITITADNQILLAGKPVDKTTLNNTLRTLVQDNKSVAIISDTKAQLGVVLEVRDLALEAGVKQLHIRAKVKTGH